MSNFERSLEETIEVMNIAFFESQKGEDVWSLEFKKLFEKAAKKVERMLRIKSLAEGRSV